MDWFEALRTRIYRLKTVQFQEGMELNSREALRIFRAKGVEWLRHANTVQTVCTFFREGHLLARGVVHERDLSQTDQISDEKDRALGVWYDLFFDASDLHARFKQRNFYGPVLLNFDLALLEQDWVPFVWVTKRNPVYWTRDTPSDERWFSSIEELEAGYDPKEAGHHIVLRNVAGTVRLNPYLCELILDYTKRCRPGSDKTLSEEAAEAIVAAAVLGKVPKANMKKFYRPHSGPGCFCSVQYKDMKLSTALKFFSANG